MGYGLYVWGATHLQKTQRNYNQFGAETKPLLNNKMDCDYESASVLSRASS